MPNNLERFDTFAGDRFHELLATEHMETVGIHTV